MSKDTFYFSHDYNARSDRKLVKLLMKHGCNGIGIYWCIIEMLYEESGYLNISEYDRITFELRIEKNVLLSVLHDFELFESDEIKFWSNSVFERLKGRMEKSEKARKSILSRWEKQKDTNVLRTNTNRNTRKGKERKEKERKEKDIIYPTIFEVENYFFENGYTKEAGTRAFNYYSVANWTDSKGSKVKNWKQKMQAVWFKDENKIKNGNFDIQDSRYCPKWDENNKPNIDF